MVLSTGAARASTLSGSSIARVQGAEIAARSCGARVRGSTHWSGFKKSRHFGEGLEANFKIQKGGWGVPRAQDPTRTRCSNALIGSTADYPQNGANPEAYVRSDATDANSARAKRKSRLHFRLALLDRPPSRLLAVRTRKSGQHPFADHARQSENLSCRLPR